MSPLVIVIICLSFAILGYALVSRQNKAPNIHTLPKFKRTLPKKVVTSKTGHHYIIIGGNGFLGSHLVEALLARGEKDIVIFDVAESPIFQKEISSGVIRFVQGDLRDAASVSKAFEYVPKEGVSAVFHTAAVVDFWSRLPHERERVMSINVEGTRNVIKACMAAGVNKFVFASSATLCVRQDALTHPLIDLTEEEAGVPQPPYVNFYVESKVLSEQIVLEANGKNRHFSTVSIRPSGIFGPRDEWIASKNMEGVPILYSPQTKQDFIYVENVVHAFLCADSKMKSPDDGVSGQAYFVNNQRHPLFYMPFNKAFRDASGVKYNYVYPPWILDVLAFISETCHKFFGYVWFLGPVNVLTPCALVLSRATYHFNDVKARTLLGYQPVYTMEEAVDICVKFYKPDLDKEHKSKAQ